MTAFTLNGGATTNFDTLAAASANATLDTYAISNNTTLLIDTDSYACANRTSTNGSLDTVTYSGIGGKLRIDGTNVRVIAYTGGSGNVPAVGTTISQGGVSATLLGVWSGWQAENTAVGAAMPATGYIKVKNKTGGNYAAGALTGITATSAGADVVGWIEVRGADTAAITVPRVGTFEVVGDWFELGTTNGTRGQVLACPTTATIAGVFPGVWIETAAGSGVYEKFTGAGSMVNLAGNPTDIRGKVVWQTTSGIRIGSDGTNNVGFLPPTGCKVRIPNVILTCCTRTAGGSGPRVTPSATLTTRQEFVTTSSGTIAMDKAVVNWYCNFQQPYSVVVTNCAVSTTLAIAEQATALNVQGCIVSPAQAQIASPLNLTYNAAGGVVSNNLFARFSLASSGAYVSVCSYSTGIAFSNNISMTLTNRANGTTGTWSCLQAVDCTWTDETIIGGRMLFTSCIRPSVTNPAYADNFSGTTGTGNGHYAIDVTTGCVDIVVTGFTILATNCQPYNGIFIAINSYNIVVKSIGTFASPLNLGTVNAANYIAVANGACVGVAFKRLYASNTRTAPFAFTNSDNNILVENVAGDYADAQVVSGLNAMTKGCGLIGSTTGQTAVYGTHWHDKFSSATVGAVEITCNEPTAVSADQCSITAGTPRFNSSGSVLLTTVGDQVTWTCPYFVKGHTALANLAPSIAGTNTANITMQYQIDTGSGFGATKTLNAANLSAETISPSTGFKLKIIATCATANATNGLTNIRVATVTSAVAQSTNLYPLTTVTVEVTNLKNPSEVRIFNAGTTDQIDGIENVTTGTFSTSIDAATYPNVDISVLSLGYQNIRYTSQNISSGLSLFASQVIDRQYENA